MPANFVLPLLLFLTVLPAAADVADDLWDAARAGDLARVKSLVEAGAAVDAPTRYGATALTFAAEKGHREVVEYLLGKGADPDPRDSFYNQTPLGWALGGQHYEIAALLVARGASDVDQALLTGVQLNQPALVRAVVERGPVFPYQKTSALAAAQSAGHAELTALLATAEVRPLETVDVDAAVLARYAGRYRIGNGERTLEVVAGEDGLTVREEGVDDHPLVAVSPTHFRSRRDQDVGVLFYGRGGTVEGMVLVEKASQKMFAPWSEDDVEASKPRRPLFKKKEEPAAPVVEDASPRSEPVDWPSFRGAGAAGVADGQGAPTTWDVETGANVQWKAEIPGLANSSPIVWDDRVFVTTAVSSQGDNSIKTGLYGDFAVVDDLSEHAWKVIALDKADGSVVWERTASTAVPLTTRHTKSTQANSTPATDGRRVVAVFPTAGLFCYGVDGELKWHRDLGALDAGWFYDASYQWGFAASPVIYEDLVILQADVQEGSFIAAYDLETGREVWKTRRDEIPTWATPTLVRGPERDELVANGTTIRGYDPRTGKELWTLGPNSEVIIATPILAHGLIYVTASYPPVRPIYAVRPGSAGDLTLADGATKSEAIAWSSDRGGSYMPTPIVVGDVFYVGRHQGRIEAFDARTGESVYRARFSRGGTFTGSPVAADGRLFFTTEDGLVYVVKAGRTYEELAVNDMKEVVMTTPAISDGSLFIRTRTHLYALGEKEQE